MLKIWRKQWLEGIILVLATPWLLFPTLMPWITASMLLILLGSWWLKGRFPWPVSPFNPIILLWSFGLLMGIVVSEDPDLTLPKALGLFLGLAIWRHLVVTIHNRSQLYWATLLFNLLVTAMVVLGALSTDWQIEILFFQRWQAYFPSRLFHYSAIPDGVHMNQLAGILAYFTPFFLVLWAGLQQKGGRRLFFLAGLILIGMMGWLLLLSQSRSAWLGVCAGIGVGFILWSLTISPKSKLRWLPAGIIVIGILALFGLVIKLGPDNLAQVWRELPSETAVGSFSTFAFRRELWHWAITAISDAPVTGVGLGAFRRYLFRHYTPDLDPTFDVAHAHNVFMQIALDVGLPGLFAYIALLILAFWIGWKIIRNMPEFQPFVLGLLSGLIALHVYGLLDAMAPGAKPGWILWYSFGLIAAMGSMLENVGEGFLAFHKPDIPSQANDGRKQQ